MSDHAGHDHSHAPPTYNRAFAVGIVLNLSFVVAETIFGLSSQSLALVADAGHNLSDVLGLALAWGAAILAKRQPTKRRTYGFRRATILAALANAVLILVATGGVAWEAVRRLSHPVPVVASSVILVAAAGVFVNGVSAILFRKGSKTDLNVRGAFLHLVADAAVSGAVVLTGVLMVYTRFFLLDPIVSLLVSAFIAVSSWRLLRKAIDVSLDAVPDGVNLEAIREYLAGLPLVSDVHDLHVWAISTTENALTAHLSMQEMPAPGFACDVDTELRHRYSIHHVTIQVCPALGPCELTQKNAI